MSLINKIKTKLQRIYEIVQKTVQILFNEGFYSLSKKIIGYLDEKETIQPLQEAEAECLLETADKEHTSSTGTEPVLVYQMGRVGSRSIQVSLEQLFNNSQSPRSIYRAHWLNNFDVLEQRAKIDLVDSSQFGMSIKYARETLQPILQQVQCLQKFKIVSIVRDPVARNVSTFFYSLDEFIPDWEDRTIRNSLTVDDLHNIFVSKRSFVLSALNWFDEQMMPVFDIDVYAIPFPKEKGYKIYSSAKADLLLLRLEDLQRCTGEAFREFLNIENFELLKINSGEERKTGNLYKLFNTKPLSSEYVHWTYNSQLARHFYTADELKTFTRSWVDK
jgi:hypothetical protein